MARITAIRVKPLEWVLDMHRISGSFGQPCLASSRLSPDDEKRLAGNPGFEAKGVARPANFLVGGSAGCGAGRHALSSSALWLAG
jgi:hypothetical protein